MKNIELYRTIEVLVETKKQQYTPNKPSFAHEYCKKQIQKKKLIPFNPRSKMSRIMKNFNQLDTYVNVEDLFEYINMKISQRKKEDKAHPNIKWKSKQQIVFNDDQIMEKVREKLGPYNQRIFMKQNQQMSEIIGQLQENSQVASHRKQNSPGCDDITFFNDNTKNKDQGNKFSEKQKWRYYEGNNYVFEDPSQKKSNRADMVRLQIEKPSLKKRQEKMELIHQVSTYLQIILQGHHKKKWGNKKLKVEHPAIINEPAEEPKQVKEMKQSQKETKKKLQFRVQRTSTRYTDHKSSFQRSLFSSQKSSPQNSILLMKKSNSNFSQKQTCNSEINKYIAKKVGVNENFTFRNRNIKQNLMKKINSFLQFVENEQKLFKQQKNYSINQLNNIENKEKINDNDLCGKNFMVDDVELKAVQKIVHMQK